MGVEQILTLALGAVAMLLFLVALYASDNTSERKPREKSEAENTRLHEVVASHRNMGTIRDETIAALVREVVREEWHRQGPRS